MARSSLAPSKYMKSHVVFWLIGKEVSKYRYGSFKLSFSFYFHQIENFNRNFRSGKYNYPYFISGETKAQRNDTTDFKSMHLGNGMARTRLKAFALFTEPCSFYIHSLDSCSKCRPFASGPSVLLWPCWYSNVALKLSSVKVVQAQEEWARVIAFYLDSGSLIHHRLPLWFWAHHLGLDPVLPLRYLGGF